MGNAKPIGYGQRVKSGAYNFGSNNVADLGITAVGTCGSCSNGGGDFILEEIAYAMKLAGDAMQRGLDDCLWRLLKGFAADGKHCVGIGLLNTSELDDIIINCIDLKVESKLIVLDGNERRQKNCQSAYVIAPGRAMLLAAIGHGFSTSKLRLGLEIFGSGFGAKFEDDKVVRRFYVEGEGAGILEKAMGDAWTKVWLGLSH